MITYFHPVMTLRMSRAIPPITHLSSRHTPALTTMAIKTGIWRRAVWYKLIDVSKKKLVPQFSG